MKKLLLLCLFAWMPLAMANPSTHVFTPPNWPASLSLDFYAAESAQQPTPVVMVIHGGGWRSGARDDGYIRSICEFLVSQGVSAASVSYRLSDQAAFPAQLDDLSLAMTWLQQNAQQLDIDPSKLSVWGYSAGAHLASLLAIQHPTQFKAVVAGGTPADLRVWPESPMVLALLKQPRDQAPALWADASPVAQARPNTPPHFLYHGKWDVLVAFEQAQMLEAALKAQDVPVELYTRSVYGHMLTAILPGNSYQAALAFLAEQGALGQ